MKKVILLIMLILLCGCSGSSATFEEMAEHYQEIEAAVINPAEQAQTYLSDDYKALLSQIDDQLEALPARYRNDAAADFDALYENAIILKKLSDLNDNEASEKLAALSAEIIDLIRISYDKDTDTLKKKAEISTLIDEIRSFDADTWATIEKRVPIKWSEVETDLLAKTEETIAGLPDKKSISEYELEEMKNVIVNGYEKIAKGVNDYNLETASDIYLAAASLENYAEGLENEAGVKVYQLAVNTKEYVESCFGLKIDDPEYAFPQLVEAAKKWPLSLWNEMTTELLLKR